MAMITTEPTLVVIDRETCGQATYDFQMRGCALLSPGELASACVEWDPLARCVYDVVHERAVALNSNQEWKYDLQQSMASEPPSVTRVTQAPVRRGKT